MLSYSLYSPVHGIIGISSGRNKIFDTWREVRYLKYVKMSLRALAWFGFGSAVGYGAAMYNQQQWLRGNMNGRR